MVHEETQAFKLLYKKSNAAFFPLSDPLDVSVQLHRQMSWQREEVYSDWLQWTLLQLADAKLISQVLDIEGWRHFDTLTITRERIVQRGFESKAGRLDLVIYDHERCVAVVEVKTRDHEAMNLEKQKGYVQSIEAENFIFLAVDPPESSLHGFRFLAWKDVCIELRKIAKDRLKPHQILSTALVLVFVAAVEQNLLGFNANSWNPAKMPAMVEHFTEFLQGQTDAA